MRIFIKSVCVATAIAMLFSIIPFGIRCRGISREVFRLHILANSDSPRDQRLKLRVRDAVLRYSEGLYERADSESEAETLTRAHLREFADIASRELRECGCDMKVSACVGKSRFSNRRYGELTMPAGTYSALKIVIGSGMGHNWWCVMYPALCVGASADVSEIDDAVGGDGRETMTGETDFRFWFWERLVELFG